MVATRAPWRQRILQKLKRSLLGRHLSAMATESPKSDQVRSPLGGGHGDLPCKWRPSALSAWSPLRVAMATLMAQVATSSLFQGRHLWWPWRPRGCKWRPLHKMVMVATCQIARKMVFEATFSSNRFTHQGRHSDQIATKAPPQRIKQLSVHVQE